MSNMLVIDDEAAVRQHFATLFRSRGHAVLEAESGARGLALLNDDARPRVDLVLVDLIMPGGHGFDVIDGCRTMPDRPKIVAMSGKGNPSFDYLAYSLSRGADWAYCKGGTLTALAQAIDILLAGGTLPSPFQQTQRARLSWPTWLLRSAP